MTTPRPERPEDVRVEQHAGLVWLIAKRYARAAHGAIDIEDLAQAGWLGAMRGARTYDSTLSSPSTYLGQWIRQAVQREVANRAEAVRVSICEQARRGKAGEPRRALVCSLDAPLGDEGCTTHLDQTPSPDAPSADDLLDAKTAPRRLEELMASAELSDRERQVLMQRARGDNLFAIGEEIGVCRERVRQIECQALDKLRRAAGVADDVPRVSLTERQLRRRTPGPKRKPGRPRAEP